MSSSRAQRRMKISRPSTTTVPPMFVSDRRLRARMMCFTSTTEPVLSNVSMIDLEYILHHKLDTFKNSSNQTFQDDTLLYRVALPVY